MAIKRRVKKPYIAATLIVFLLSLCPAFALTINAQNSTTCSNNYCETTLDLGKYFTAGQINTIKGLDLSTALPKVTGIKSIDYKIFGNTFVVYGYIDKNVYWNMPVSTLSIDPWWNVTNYYYSSDNTWKNPYTLGGASADTTNWFGQVIRTTTNASKLIGVHFPSNVYTNVTVWGCDGNCMIYSNSSGGNGWANFTNAVLNASSNYSIMAVPYAGAQRIYFLTPTYPNVTKDYNVTAGMSTTPPFPYSSGNTLTFEFDYIVSQTYVPNTSSTYYTFALNINNNASNITVGNGTLINMSIVTNLTNINSTLYINGTVYNSTIGNLTNKTTLTPGLWNITAGSNNTDSLTLWATYSPPPVTSNITIAWNVNMNDAPGICLADNKTFQRQTNLSYGSTYQTLTENYTCPYGCSANTCNYPTWINSIITLVIVGAALFLIYKVV